VGACSAATLEPLEAPSAGALASADGDGSWDGVVGLDAVQAASDSAATNDQAAILLTLEKQDSGFERNPR